jgi:hypothetical protein
MASDRSVPDDDLRLDAPPPVDENGIDLSLIEGCLRLTPAERIQQHYEFRLSVEEMMRAGERFYGSPHPDIEEIERQWR